MQRCKCYSKLFARTDAFSCPEKYFSSQICFYDDRTRLNKYNNNKRKFIRGQQHVFKYFAGVIIKGQRPPVVRVDWQGVGGHQVCESGGRGLHRWQGSRRGYSETGRRTSSRTCPARNGLEWGQPYMWCAMN